MKWTKTKLGDLCHKITDGSHNPPKGIGHSNYMMLSSKNVFDNKITTEDPRFLSKKDFEKENKRTEVSANDVLLTIVGTVGRVAVVPNNFPKITLQRSVAVFKPNDNLISSRFLMHSLQNILDILMEGARGVAQKGVYLKTLRNIVIPLPSLPEQKRIAAILDKADAIRKKRQQALDLADQFVRSVFLDMFGDPVKNPKGFENQKLCDLVDIQGGGTPSKENKKYWDGSFPWVSAKDMKQIQISHSKNTISEIVFEETNIRRIPKGSILLVVRGMILIHSFPIGITTRPVSINQDLKALIPGDRLLPEFLLWNLQMQKQYLLGKVSTAAHGTKRFDTENLNNLSIYIPKMPAQKQFVRIALKIGDLINKLNFQQRGFDGMNISLAQKAFQGDI